MRCNRIKLSYKLEWIIVLYIAWYRYIYFPVVCALHLCRGFGALIAKLPRREKKKIEAKYTSDERTICALNLYVVMDWNWKLPMNRIKVISVFGYHRQQNILQFVFTVLAGGEGISYRSVLFCLAWLGLVGFAQVYRDACVYSFVGKKNEFSNNNSTLNMFYLCAPCDYKRMSISKIYQLFTIYNSSAATVNISKQ